MTLRATTSPARRHAPHRFAPSPLILLPLLGALLLVPPGIARSQGQGADPGGAERPGAGEPQRLETVVIRADRTLEERFASTGSRVTINRNDIEQMGADSIADVLRQLPGVQTSGGASGNLEIRMRGMDRSATQILVDGQRVGSGRRSGQLPFDQLPADMIEPVSYTHLDVYKRQEQ